MKLFSLLDYLAEPAASAEAAVPRRALLRQLGQAAAATLPLSLLGPAVAQAGPAATLDNLTLLLRAERTQAAFYARALAVSGLLTGSLRADVQRLQSQQQDHIGFLSTALTNSGVTVPTAPTSYDFTGIRGGRILFPKALSDVAGFLDLAQQLEDAGVRTYLGQLVLLTADRALLGAVQRLSAVESRHAAHVRQLRRRAALLASTPLVKTWPSANDAAPANPLSYLPALGLTPSKPPVLTTLYAGEANEQQFIAGYKQIPFNALLQGDFVVQSVTIAEAFDEPLSTADAGIIWSLFAD